MSRLPTLVKKLEPLFFSDKVGTVEDILTLFELYKVLYIEDPKKDEPDDTYLNTNLDLKLRLIIKDLGEILWLSINGTKVEYGKGGVEDATFTISCSLQQVFASLFNFQSIFNLTPPMEISGNKRDAENFDIFIFLSEDPIGEIYVGFLGLK